MLEIVVFYGGPDMETDKIFFKQLKTGSGSLGCTNKIILRRVKKVSSRTKPQTFIKAEVTLLRELLGGIPEVCLEKQRCSGALGDFWRQHAPSTRAVHPPKQEKEHAQQETSLVKQ